MKKKYIGTKVIMAEPMTLTEAQKVLGRELKPATLEEDGYLVEYKDGYKSWSPRSVFEGAYEDFYEMTSINFGGAIQALKIGLAVRRKGWNGKGLFIIKQVPSHITGDIIPNMQSLPQSAKNILMSRENPHIDYTNQMLIINLFSCMEDDARDNYFGIIEWSDEEAMFLLTCVKNPKSAVRGISDGISDEITQQKLEDCELVGSIHDKEWQEKLNLKVL